MTESVSTTVETSTSGAPADTSARAEKRRRAPQSSASGKTAGTQRPVREVHPVLEQLAQLYPALFGANFLPLKRGIFQDLLQRHGDVLDKAGLKVALAIHTRSTRYLNVVAMGLPRHDLEGKPVEDTAAEHVFHALVEVFKRKKPRDGEDLQAKLQRRMGMAFMASGMSRDDYLACVQIRDEAIQALLEAALAEVEVQDAKAEAVARAFAVSGTDSVQAFADMYGMHPQAVQRQLERAKQLQSARQQA